MNSEKRKRAKGQEKRRGNRLHHLAVPSLPKEAEHCQALLGSLRRTKFARMCDEGQSEGALPLELLGALDADPRRTCECFVLKS